jgi:hypothetical protein
MLKSNQENIPREVNMGSNEVSGKNDKIVKKVKDEFPSVYLTLISIIQASVVGYLIITMQTHWGKLTLTNWMPPVATFLLIITVWNEYMMGSTTFRWIPRLKDSFLPFALGISEIYVVSNIVEYLYSWCFSTSVFSFIGFLAFLNMFHSAKRHPENDPIFERIGKLEKMTKICAFSLAIVFALLGIISYTLKANPIAEIIIGAFSLILILAFLYRGVKYWERIVDTEKKRT